MKRHTYDTGIIGNCAFLAHIGTNTNFEWLCWPRFDSTFIFGGLLDKKKGGEFSILPDGTLMLPIEYFAATISGDLPALVRTVAAPCSEDADGASLK